VSGNEDHCDESDRALSRLGALALPTGVVAVVVGLSVFHSSIAVVPYDYVNSFRFSWSVVYMVFLVVTAYAVGLPDVPRRRRQVVGASVVAALLGATGISLLQLALGATLLPRLVVFGSAMLLVPWFMICSALSAVARHADEERDRVVVVGQGEDAAALAEEISRSAERPATLEAVISPIDARAMPDGSTPLLDLIVGVRATVVVLDRTAQLDQTIVDQVAVVHESGVRVRTLSLFYDEWLGKLPIGELERVSLMFDIGEIHRLRYGRTKRVIDISLAVVGLPVLLAVTPLIAVANMFANRGSLLFRQRRVGKGGHVFTMWKFRTMHAAAADGGGPVSGECDVWTGERDSRVTPFGRLLRRSHLDELPQLVNIIRGDLSLVGPRPEQPGYVDELSAKLPFYEMRHLVQPGLTGWAQVKFGYASSDADALEKLQYEFWYLRHQSLAVDARILTRTLRSVLGGYGR